jgi:hypothetical protein
MAAKETCKGDDGEEFGRGWTAQRISLFYQNYLWSLIAKFSFWKVIICQCLYFDLNINIYMEVILSFSCITPSMVYIISVPIMHLTAWLVVVADTKFWLHKAQNWCRL